MRATTPASHSCGGLLVAAMFALATAHPAQAHTFCVASTGDLQDALTATSNGGPYIGEDNAINIVQGTYLTGAEAFHHYSSAAHILTITGGYTDASCTEALKKDKPQLVKLDGHGATGVLTLTHAKGAVSVETLTIQNGDADIGAGLQVNYLATPEAYVLLHAVIIRNNHSSSDAGGVYAVAGGQGLYLINSLIANNSADHLYGAGYVLSYSDYSYIVSDTVARNTSAAASNAVGGLYVGGTTTCNIEKNIFWGNTGPGLYLGNVTAQLLNNDYGNLGGTSPSIDIGPVSQNPKFIDADNGNFRLAGDSPLLGYSTFLASSSMDLDGNIPPGSGRMDLGAFYETIFVDGLEGD